MEFEQPLFVPVHPRNTTLLQRKLHRTDSDICYRLLLCFHCPALSCVFRKAGFQCSSDLDVLRDATEGTLSTDLSSDSREARHPPVSDILFLVTRFCACPCC